MCDSNPLSTNISFTVSATCTSFVRNVRISAQAPILFWMAARSSCHLSPYGTNTSLMTAAFSWTGMLPMPSATAYIALPSMKRNSGLFSLKYSSGTSEDRLPTAAANSSIYGSTDRVQFRRAHSLTSPQGYRSAIMLASSARPDSIFNHSFRRTRQSSKHLVLTTMGNLLPQSPFRTPVGMCTIPNATT